VSETDLDGKFAGRLAAQGLRLIGMNDAKLVAECVTCRAHWEIAIQSPGQPHEDEASDWWWCPNGCNRAE